MVKILIIKFPFFLFILIMCFIALLFIGCPTASNDGGGTTTPKVVYTVTFDSQGATVAANPTSKTVTSPAATVVTLPTSPTKTGYTFGGWWTAANGGGTAFTASTKVTASITVYAKWTKISGIAIGWIGGGGDGWQTGSAPVSGTDYQSFSLPKGVCVDGSGNIYIADFNNRICKWNSSGNAIGWIGGGSNGWQTGNAPGYGTGYQSFYYPEGVSVDSLGNIYVADYNNSRICKWDSAGTAIGWIGGGSNGWQTGSIINSGKDYRRFDHPTGVCVDGSGNIYVADGNHRICKWNSSGNAIGWIGSGSNGWQTGNAPIYGTDYQSFKFPRRVSVDGSGNIYIDDQSNHRICKWNSSGNAIGWIGSGSNGWQTGNAPISGTDYQSFNYPTGIYVDGLGDIYVADLNNRICKWNSAGNAIGWIGCGSNGWQTGAAPGTSGTDYQSFNGPLGVFVDSSGNIYVPDRTNCRLCKWR